MGESDPRNVFSVLALLSFFLTISMAVFLATLTVDLALSNTSPTVKSSTENSATAGTASTSPYNTFRQSNTVSSSDTSRDAVHCYLSSYATDPLHNLNLSDDASIAAHRARAQAAIDRFDAQWKLGI